MKIPTNNFKSLVLAILLLALIVKSTSAQTGEFLIDSSIVYIAAGGNQEVPAVAFNGTYYMVVWEAGNEIYCCRVDQSGNVLDPGGIKVTDDEYNQLRPAVAYDGSNFLVVWQDNRTAEGDIYGARVTPSGIVMEVNGFLISGAVNFQWEPVISSDGTNSLVVWKDNRSSTVYSDIYGTRVSQGGTILEPNGILISGESSSQQTPSIAFDGTNYLVVWRDNRSGVDIYGCRVSQTGTLLDPSGVPISTANAGQGEPSVAFNGTNYLVTWEDYRNGGVLDIYGARVNVSGTVLDPGGLVISTASGDQGKPSVASDGNNFLIAWTDGRNFRNDIYGARVDNSGKVLEQNGIAITTADQHQTNSAVVFGILNYLVIWEDKRLTGYNDIFGARMQSSGVVLDPNAFLITLGVNYQNNPSTAFDGSNYLVVWEDFRSSSFDIYGTRVTSSGVVLDPQPIMISSEVNDQSRPSVIFDGTNFFVIWEDERNDPYASDIYGARLNPAGTVLDPNGILISTAPDDQIKPKLGFDGVNYLAVWEDYRNDAFDPDIYGARISQSGVLLDPNGITIQTVFDNIEELPSVAFDGTNYMVVWEDERNYGDIYGARVNQNGLVLDPNGIVIFSYDHSQGAPVITFGGTNYLVLWEDRRNGQLDIYGAVIDPSGIIQDTAVISIAPGAQESVNLVYEDSAFTAVWGDYRNDASYPDIYGARISSTGEVLDSFSVIVGPGSQTNPALTHGTGSISLLVYSGSTENYNNKTFNAMRIWGKVIDTSTGVESDETHIITGFQLLQNYPNPFNPSTVISYQLPVSSEVTLKVYDVLGNEIATLVDEFSPAGQYHYDFNGEKLISGIYFYKLQVGSFISTKRMIYLK